MDELISFVCWGGVWSGEEGPADLRVVKVAEKKDRGIGKFFFDFS